MKKSFVYLTLALVLLLMIGYVYLHRSKQQQKVVRHYQEYPVEPPAARAAESRPDFTSFLDEQTEYPQAVSYRPAQPVQREVTYRPLVVRDQNAPKRYVATTKQTVPTTTTRRYAYPNTTNSSVAQRNTYVRPNTAGYSAAPVTASATPADKTASTDMLGDYSANLTYQQQKDLNLKLKDMSLGIDRAIARAFSPKGDQNEFIAKYLQRRGSNGEVPQGAQAAASSATAVDAGTQVAQQIASQASGIVQSVKQAYGAQAAGRASQIMSDFSEEMQHVMNSSLPEQEKQILAQKINQKYNDKLQKLNKEESSKKLESQLRTEQEKQLAEIRTQLNPETEAAVRAKMEENLQKRLAIMQTAQSEESMYKQLLELEEKQRKDIEAIVQKYNANDLSALSKWRNLQNDAVKEQILKESEDVASGKKQSQLFKLTQDTLEKDFKPAWQKEDTAITQGLSSYGSDVQNQASQILQQMRNEQAKIVSEGGDLAEVNRKNMELTEKANKQLQALRQANKGTFVQNKTAELNQQNQERLQHYANYLSNATEDTKQQWKQQAEPILEKYNNLRAQLLADADNNPNLSDAFNRLAQQEQQELSSIQIVPAQ